MNEQVKEMSPALEQATNEFRTFVTDGMYALKGQYSNNNKTAKGLLRDHLHTSDEKRHEFKELGWVAKFVPKQRRKIDHAAIIEELLCYIRSEALSQTITFDKKRIEADGALSLIEPHQYPSTYFIRPTLNKFGKQFGDIVTEDYKGLSPVELVRRIEYNTTRYKDIEVQYDKILKNILLPFKDMEMQKISLDVGSISKIANAPTYDVHKIFESLGLEFLLEYGQVKIGAVEEWIGIKAVPADILSKNSYVEEITLDFTVMTLQAEANAHNAFKRMREYKYLIV